MPTRSPNWIRDAELSERPRSARAIQNHRGTSRDKDGCDPTVNQRSPCVLRLIADGNPLEDDKFLVDG